MDQLVAKHILGSQNIEELKDIGKRASTRLDDHDRGFEARRLEAELRSGMKSLGAQMASQEDLAQAKDRLLSLMEQAGDLVGLGKEGSFLSGGDFQGAAPAGRVSPSALRGIVAPERAARAGTHFVFKEGQGGELAASESKFKVMPNGAVSMTAATIAARAVDRIETAIGGFDSIFKAAAECESNHQRLGSIVSHEKTGAWSRAEMSRALESQFEGKLVPLGPESDDFPKPLAQSNLVAKLEQSRKAEPVAPELPSPKGA
jgi:hypothetical protein